MITSNKEMEHIITLNKSLEESVLLIQCAIQITENEKKKKTIERFLGILLGILGASLSGNL